MVCYSFGFKTAFVRSVLEALPLFGGIENFVRAGGLKTQLIVPWCTLKVLKFAEVIGPLLLEMCVLICRCLGVDFE